MKNELIKNKLMKKIEDLEERITELENDVDYWQYEYDRVYEQLDDAVQELNKCGDGIETIDDFIWRLKLDNLYSNELDKFICEYVKYYQGGKNENKSGRCS